MKYLKKENYGKYKFRVKGENEIYGIFNGYYFGDSNYNGPDGIGLLIGLEGSSEVIAEWKKGLPHGKLCDYHPKT